MKCIYTKGNQRITFNQLAAGDYEIEHMSYLTAYRYWGCRTRRTVPMAEAKEIMARLERKGYSVVRV